MFNLEVFDFIVLVTYLFYIIESNNFFSKYESFFIGYNEDFYNFVHSHVYMLVIRETTFLRRKINKITMQYLQFVDNIRKKY